MQARALVALLALASSGCVERALLVRTEPPGALVFVDGREVGVAPAGEGVRVPFDFYGTRVVVARKPGYAPARVEAELSPPWWQLTPFDLITDVLWPATLVDEHTLVVRLERRPAPGSVDELEGRARDFAAQAERRP